MCVHMSTLPAADRGIQKGGSPVTGRKLRIGIVTPAAVVQPQGRQRPTEALACTWNRRFPCTCTPLSHAHSPISTHPRRSAFKIRLQGAVSCAVLLRLSIIVPALENRWRSFNSTIRLRQTCRSPYSPSTRVTGNSALDTIP